MKNFLSGTFRLHAAAPSARLMRQERERLIRALASGAPGARVNRFDEPASIFEQRIGESLDLLAGHIEGRPHFDALYAGQRLFELHRPEQDRPTNLSAARSSVEHDLGVLRDNLSPHLEADDMRRFESAYREATVALCGDAPKHVKTLFIGDCLLVEIMSFLVGPLLKEGISIDAFPINSRDVRQMRGILDGLALSSYDVVFFSPFSHARLPELEVLLDPKKAWSTRGQVNELVGSVIAQTAVLLDFLADRFECPIFVHNASMTLRATNAAKAVASGVMLASTRSTARTAINHWLAGYVQGKNQSTFRHLFVLDECALAAAVGGHRAGRFLYESPFQHATVLSQILAVAYQERIGTIAALMGKKLIVCDLDNTLWDGVIGEGAVEHFADRQQTLKRLKDDGGIVLSIASKNDPSNVHFNDGVLSEADFVAPQISWLSKARAVEQIKSKLNLQTKHMVFLDDRPDERAIVQEAFPDMLVLDPCDSQVWARMNLWADLVEGSSDLDRTQLYQQQLVRDVLAGKGDEVDALPEHEALEKLELTFTVGPAKKGDLKRVAELINRTNQWNMCGSRTTFEQVRAWHESESAHLMLGSASDRFGDMGTVCVAVMTVTPAAAEIPVFVLSCRVFGYGVETAMLAQMSRLSIQAGKPKLIGKFRATSQNYPGRHMYRDHGFDQAGEDFSLACRVAIMDVPWATIRIEL